MRPHFKWLFIALSMTFSAITSAQDLKVEVSGLRSNKGDVHIALFNKPKNFPYSEAIYIENKSKIRNKKSSYTFKSLSEGYYAVAVYHDENNNNKFDQNFFGIPLEDFGFSNGAKTFLGPPTFEDAKFLIEKTSLKVTIKLNH